MFTEDEQQAVLKKCSSLPPAQGNYLEDDFVTNLMCTVLDFQMQTTTVGRALQYYKQNRWTEIRTLEDVKRTLSRYKNDKEGNAQAAQYLWGYKLWTRVQCLRDLIHFFEMQGIASQQSLRQWAHQSDFKRDFEGKIKGLGYAVYKWLIMRQGVETVKPDVHLRRFVQNLVLRDFSDEPLVNLLENIAAALNLKAYELDWRIWEFQKGKPE